MARRDNAPKKKKTKRSLPQNIQELVNKAKGSPRGAWIKSMERLQKRIEKVEKQDNAKVDIEQLPQRVKEFILYGIVPNRVLRKYIKEVEDIRSKELRNIKVDTSFWEDFPEPDDYDEYDTQYDSSNEPFHVSDKEIGMLYSMIDEFSSTELREKFRSALDDAIEEYGRDNVAMHVADNFSSLERDVRDAITYEYTRAKSSEYFYREFKQSLTGIPLDYYENQLATRSAETFDGWVE